MNIINTAMIIDDDQINHILVKRIIKRSKRIKNTMSFTYADEALEYLKRKDRESVDIIFLDINMPRMNGFEFLAAATDQLGNSFANAVVVMLTTSLDEHDKERATQFEIEVTVYLSRKTKIPEPFSESARHCTKKDPFLFIVTCNIITPPSRAGTAPRYRPSTC